MDTNPQPIDEAMTFTLKDHSGGDCRREVRVRVSRRGSDFLWLNFSGYGDPDSGSPVAIEFWGGRLRILAWNKGGDHDDPTVVDLEALRAFHLGATVGRQQGWDVFNTGTSYVVQREDERQGGEESLPSDEEAIRLAREAGVDCDDNGTVRGLGRA
jgi:hypothetical protein